MSRIASRDLSSGVERLRPIQFHTSILIHSFIFLGWRLPFILQWVWPVPLFIGVYLAPESPWWLVRKQRNEDAKIMLARLSNSSEATQQHLDQKIAMMIYTTEMEKASTEGTSYLDCFRGDNLRRTEIVSLQVFVGKPTAKTDYILGRSVVLRRLGNPMVVRKPSDRAGRSVVSTWRVASICIDLADLTRSPLV